METAIREYAAGDLRLQSGFILRNTKLVYKTFGRLNAAKDNVILYPTWFAGTHNDNEWLIGEGRALDPERYFIIIPNMLGNGQSSSPDNTPAPFNAARFPPVTVYDNVRLQHRLLTSLGIHHLQLVLGWSLGAMQTFQWGALYPDMVARIAPFCGAAKTSPHTFLFFEGLKAALSTDAAWQQGWYQQPPAAGLRAMSRVLAGWAFSQKFYQQELYRHQLGYASLEDFLVAFWENAFLSWDANNILAMIWTAQHADISANELYQGKLQEALGAIKAKAFVMPGETDLYFPAADSRQETALMPNAHLIPIPSIWGHFAGGRGINPADVQFLDDQLKLLLAS
jgi:homoserine O-acetyltransferase